MFDVLDRFVGYVLDSLQQSNYSIVFNRVVMTFIHGLQSFICGRMDKTRSHVYCVKGGEVRCTVICVNRKLFICVALDVVYKCRSLFPV
jgi:hypothetical protein